MGSALATPLAARGQEVRLWGTWLDDHLLDAIEAGSPHPRTSVPVPDGVRLYRSDALTEALDGSDVVILAVASVGVDAVVRLAAPHMGHVRLLGVTSKGFLEDSSGKVRLLPESITGIFESLGLPAPIVVAAGGPCKANEVALGRPTATVYGSDDIEAARSLARDIETDDYRIETIDDIIGLEVAAPLKNVYAIALGFADGLERATGEPWHNLKSAIFAQALREMALVATTLGGRAETVFGLAGVGDLEVTGLSGRNKVYGARIGSGETAADALNAMILAEQTVEGVPAATLAVTLAASLLPEAGTTLPLLFAIGSIIEGGSDPLEQLTHAVLPATVDATKRVIV
ncbi:MAG: glycerol-3-phosphate dehydrogenase [Burkholderiaceae bacterium]|nr:glycerol-3-phosphate dehydrogenase [Microbacteriaceae bacterium]